MHLRLFAVAVVAIGASSIRSEGQALARLGIAAGITTPVSAYASDKHAGYHFGLWFDVRVPATPLEFRIDGALHEMRYSNNSTKDQILIVSGSALVAVPTGTVLVPYVVGGLGLYNSQRFLSSATDQSNALGWSAGGGLRFEMTDLTMFVEARYHWTNGEGRIRIVPVSLGVFF